MLIIKEGDWIFEDCYQGLLSNIPSYEFRHDAIVMSRKEAENLWKALTTKPIECDSEEEIADIQSAVKELETSLQDIGKKRNGNDLNKENRDRELIMKTDIIDPVGKWKHEMPHFRYSCDRGTFAMRLNGLVTIRIDNGVGDGNYPVYVNPPDMLPATFKPTNLCIDGTCTVEPMNYDCNDAEPLTSIILNARDHLRVYRDNEGAIGLITYQY